MAVRAMKTEKGQLVPWLFGGLALLYNPVLLVHLNEKAIWMMVNAFTAVVFIVFRNLTTSNRVIKTAAHIGQLETKSN